MKHTLLRTTALSAVLLLATAGVAAQALSIDLGTNAGGNNTSAHVGDSAGPLANVTNSGNNTNADVNLGSLLEGIDLSGLDLNGIDLGGIGGGTGGVGVGDTDVDVGIGLGTDGEDGAPGANGSAGTNGGTSFASFTANLPSADRQLLKNRCRAVLDDPDMFKTDVVNLCRMIAQKF